MTSFAQTLLLTLEESHQATAQMRAAMVEIIALGEEAVDDADVALTYGSS